MIVTLLDFRKSNLLYVFKGPGKSHCSACIYGACLKFMWNLCVCGRLTGNVFDHFTATHEWIHDIKNFLLAVKNTDSHWTANLMSGECKEIHIQILNINLKMRSALGSITNNDSTLSAVSDFMSIFGNLFHRIGNSKHIADLGN